MNWTKNRSILLSKICIFIFALAGIAVSVYINVNTEGILRKYTYMADASTVGYYVLPARAVLYILDILAYTALYMLYRLLRNIHRSEVFVFANVGYLRGLSWCCFTAAFVCLILSFFYLPLIILTAGIAFMALILRIIKNVFVEAIEIKQENEYTI